MGAKTGTSTSTVQVPPDVLARYNSVNATAETAASAPFQSYSSNPNSFVAPLTGTQQAGIQNTNTAAGEAQPFYQQATGQLLGAQSNAMPFYGQAASALSGGAAQGSAGLKSSNSAIDSGLGAAQPLNSAAQNLAISGTGAVNPSNLNSQSIGKYLSPYLGTVLGSTEALVNQQNQQAQAGQLGNAISSGAFGGDRAGIAAANLAQQQELAGANAYSNIANQGFNTALGAAQQQQGVNLGAAQANRTALQEGSGQLASLGQQEFGQSLGAGQQFANNANSAFGIGSGSATGYGQIGQGEYGLGANTANSLAGLGAGAQSAGLQGSTAQLSAGQQEQSTQQAGLTALYNQFLQQQAYPFQTAQFLGNIAEGTGSLSGSTTSTTQPTGLFGNLLSDRRAKEDIREVGKAKNGLKVYTFRYKGDPQKVTHLGFMADEVEKKHPEAVGLAGGLKTVDYDRAARADGGGLVFDPNTGQYGLGAASMPGRGTYVPAPSQSAARKIMLQNAPPAPQSVGLGQAADQYKEIKDLWKDGSDIWKDGKSMLSGLGGLGGVAQAPQAYSHGGLALKLDDGGPVNDPYNHETDDDLRMRQLGLRASEGQIARAPDEAGNGPVSGALASQASSPKYTLGQAPAPKMDSSGGLGQLASIAALGKDISPYLASLLALKSGGLVPREHHADGDSVGDDGIYSPEDARLWKPDPAAKTPTQLPTQLPKGLGAAPPPMVDPDEVAKQPALDPSRLDVPMPPVRPKDLGVVPDTPAPVTAPSPAPGLAPPQYLAPQPPPRHPSVPRAARTYDANIAPSAPSGADTAAPGPDVSAFIIGHESGGKFNAVNPASSAYGLGQFTRDTAKTVAARHPELPPLTDFYSQDPKIGIPAQQAYIATHAKDQAKVLAANNIPATAQNIHVNWFLGEAGGPAFLKGMQQNPDTPGVMLARPEQVAANKGIFYNSDGSPKTAAQVYASINGGGGNRELTGGDNSHPQQPGLWNSLGSFFHGQPDGQVSPNGGMGERALMAVLSGLGAVGSYRGQSVLGAALQGLGAGAHGWMDTGKQQADIAQTQALTGLAGAEAGRVGVGTIQDALKGAFVIGPDGVPVLKGDYMNNPGAVAGSGAVGAHNSAVPLPTGAQYKPPPPPAPDGLVPPTPIAPSAPGALGGAGRESVARDFQQTRAVAGDETKFNEFLKNNRDNEAAISDRYNAAHTMGGQLNQLGKELSDLSQDGSTLKPGPLAAWKQSLAASWNSMLGDSPEAQKFKISNPEDVGTSEAARKVSLGMSFARASSNHQNTLEALEQASAATPNMAITPAGIRKIMAAMYADKQRDIDGYNYLQQYKDYARKSGGIGKSNWYVPQNALAAFNKEHNDTEYAKLRKAIEQSLKDSYTSSKTKETLSRAAGAIQGRIGAKAIDNLYGVPGLHRVFENN